MDIRGRAVLVMRGLVALPMMVLAGLPIRVQVARVTLVPEVHGILGRVGRLIQGQGGQFILVRGGCL
jgi:hypothetical protein